MSARYEPTFTLSFAISGEQRTVEGWEALATALGIKLSSTRIRVYEHRGSLERTVLNAKGLPELCKIAMQPRPVAAPKPKRPVGRPTSEETTQYRYSYTEPKPPAFARDDASVNKLKRATAWREYDAAMARWRQGLDPHPQ